MSETKMTKHYGVLFTRKSGKIVTVLEDKHGSAFLKMFAMNGKVSATRDFVVFNAVTGNIVEYFEGKKNDLPKICYDMRNHNIEEVATGLLASLNE